MFARRIIAFIVTLFLLFPAIAAANLECFYVVTMDWMDLGFMSILMPISIDYVCSEVVIVIPPPSGAGDGGSGGGGGDGGSGGGGGSEPPPSPSAMQITYVSDENPHDVYFGISYLGSITDIRVFKNRIQINYLPTTDTSVVHIGNLDNFIDPYTTITVQVCNGSGCADDSATLVRQNLHRDTFGYLTVQYTISHMNEKVDKIATYDRSAAADYFTADWADKTVEGPHNGHYQHIRSIDALLWNSGTGLFGTTNPDPPWYPVYRFYPSWLNGGLWEDSESYCYVGGYAFDFSSVQCATVAEFARDGSPDGILHVTGTALGNDFFVPDRLSGDIDLTVRP